MALLNCSVLDVVQTGHTRHLHDLKCSEVKAWIKEKLNGFNIFYSNFDDCATWLLLFNQPSQWETAPSTLINVKKDYNE